MTEKERSERIIRVYPRVELTGEVQAISVATRKYPKFHIAEDCESLERTHEYNKIRESYSSPLTMALSTAGRPCVNCTLESVLFSTLATEEERKTKAKVFVTATGQVTPGDPDTKIYDYNWSKRSRSSGQRVKNVAEAIGFEVAETMVGPAMFGFISETGLKILTHNLRTSSPNITEMPTAEAIEFLWGFLTNSPPEMGSNATHDSLWQTAQALARPIELPTYV